MCRLDVSSRSTSKQVLDNAWMEDETPVDRSRPPELLRRASVIANVRKFSTFSRFKQEALQIVAHRLNHKDTARLQEAFRSLDANGTGQLNLQQVQQAFAHADLNTE